MRYTVLYNQITKKYDVVMDYGLPSESLYEEFFSAKDAKVAAYDLNDEAVEEKLNA